MTKPFKATCPKCNFTTEVHRVTGDGREARYFWESKRDDGTTRKVYLAPVRDDDGMCLFGYNTCHCPECDYDPIEIE